MRHPAFGAALATVACAVGIVSPGLSAQQVRLVAAGDTVRVWAPDFGLKKTKSTVLGWSDSTVLVVRLRPPPDSVTIPFGGLYRLDLLRGKSRSRGLATGAGIGVVGGLLVGALVGQAAVSDCTEFLCGLDGLNYAFGGALIGAGIGAAVGAAHPPDRWERVELPTEAGFPPYRKPFHKTVAFSLIAVALGVAVALIAN